MEIRRVVGEVIIRLNRVVFLIIHAKGMAVPLMAFSSKLRMVVNAWLRPGNTVASSNIEAFLEETFEILKGKTIGLVRADSGFFGEKILK